MAHATACQPLGPSGTGTYSGPGPPPGRAEQPERAEGTSLARQTRECSHLLHGTIGGRGTEGAAVRLGCDPYGGMKVLAQGAAVAESGAVGDQVDGPVSGLQQVPGPGRRAGG